MAHLRDNGININGSKQKITLRNIGYYHAYKGYRFIKAKNNAIKYSDFKELESIYNYDANLKSLFYSPIMYIETALKNIALDVIINDCKSSDFNVIFNNVLNNHNKYSSNKNSKDYSNEVKARNRVRDNYYKKCSDEYQKKNNISLHFQNKDIELPIWAYFEMITLGDFGYFISSCNSRTKREIANEVGIRKSFITSDEILKDIIFTLKNIRNSIAHNNVIFDTRFQTLSTHAILSRLIEDETNIHVDFSEIFDYLVLIIYMLKILKVSKRKLNQIINNYIEYTEELRENIPISIFNSFIKTNFNKKTQTLFQYVKKP